MAQKLIDLGQGRFADLAGAVTYGDDEERLFVTKKTETYILRQLTSNADWVYHEISQGEAISWMIENDLEVPEDMLAGMEIL